MLLAIADRLAGVVTRIGRSASWLAIALMLVILTDVVTRRFLVLGSGRLQDLEWHLHGALFLLCFGFAYVRDAHVRIELVRDHMSARLRAGLEIAGILLFLVPFCVLVIKFGIEFAERSYRTGETSMGGTGLPHRWIIKSFVPLGAGILLIAALSVLLRCIAVFVGPEAQRRRAAEWLRVRPDPHKPTP